VLTTVVTYLPASHLLTFICSSPRGSVRPRGEEAAGGATEASGAADAGALRQGPRCRRRSLSRAQKSVKQ
jgi:hypothetical protein